MEMPSFYDLFTDFCTSTFIIYVLKVWLWDNPWCKYQRDWG